MIQSGRWARKDPVALRSSALIPCEATLYQETLRDKAFAYLEDAGRPVPHDQLVAEVLGFQPARRGLARKLANALLRTDRRFEYIPRSGWQLAGFPDPRAFLQELTYAILDTETTGTSPTDGIVELGAVIARKGRILASFDSLVNPGIPLSRATAAMTGIAAEAIQNAPPQERMMPLFRRFIGHYVIVAHNISFDRRFLNKEFIRAGLPRLNNPALCTLAMARKLLHLHGNDLDRLAAFFNIKTRARHRAHPDALITAKVFFRLLERLSREGVHSLGDAIDYLKPARGLKAVTR